MKKLTFILSFIVMASFISAKAQILAPIKWYTFEEAFELTKTQPKKIFVDIYTDWCGWCKRMDATTFTNPTIIEILNTYYYPVKFNAEGAAPVKLGNQTFINEGAQTSGRGTHQLASAILNGKMSYPSTAYFDGQFQLIQAIPGYKTPQDMEQVLMYIQTESYKKNIKFEDFVATFKSNIK